MTCAMFKQTKFCHVRLFFCCFLNADFRRIQKQFRIFGYAHSWAPCLGRWSEIFENLTKKLQVSCPGSLKGEVWIPRTDVHCITAAGCAQPAVSIDLEHFRAKLDKNTNPVTFTVSLIAKFQSKSSLVHYLWRFFPGAVSPRCYQFQFNYHMHDPHGAGCLFIPGLPL